MSAFQLIVRARVNFCVKVAYWRLLKAERHFSTNMENADLRPPSEVRGMTMLDRNSFRKQIRVPTLRVNECLLNKVQPLVKTLLLKMEHLKPVRTAATRNGCNDKPTDKEILLHPLAVSGWESIPSDLSSLGLDESSFYHTDLELNYENWKADDILKSVLPEDQEGFSSYSRIGHVVHINLREHLEPFKKLIGEVLLDKTVGCRAVVNKTKNIDNTYRNFELELICGEPEYQVEVKEHGVVFQFDFASVYWNPRLSTEHERIVNLLEPSDVLYDVFAGVGPFSIPAAAKKKCTVLANDLNPESFKWLNVNAKKNKCCTRIKTFNKDGRDFIRQELRADLLERWKTIRPDNKYKIHIVMNLPAMAVEFLDVFRDLLAPEDPMQFQNVIIPVVHVYTFVKGTSDKETLAIEAVEANLKSTLSDNLLGVHFVRNVAPNKDMFRVSFRLSKDILFSYSRKRQKSPCTTTTDAKKTCP